MILLLLLLLLPMTLIDVWP